MESLEALDRFPLIHEIFCSLSYIFCILNEERQVVYANDVMISSLGIERIEEVVGRRFGEAFECIHASDEPGGCGTSEHCRYCGAVNSIMECHSTGEKTMKECRIRRKVQGKEFSQELEVTSTPFFFENERFTIFSLIDITDRKRKMLLERIFFHDILNTAGGLQNAFELLNLVDETERASLLTIASSLSRQIVDEITTQRLLVQVENAPMVVKLQTIWSLEFLEIVEKDLRYHQVAKGKIIMTDPSSEDLEFQTDPVILRKILNNMIKNALEASEEGDLVFVKACRMDDKIRFSVHNRMAIPQDVERQVFMRSFSTKGVQRGLGTYSMKILGEQYLNGSVGFETNELTGTTFYIDLALQEKD